MRRLRTLIVDDEPLAQQRLRSLLRDAPGVEVVGAAQDGPSAVRAIREQPLDLVLLDVKMPGLNGLEVLEAVAGHAPAVILVTAFSEYARQAFDLAATDYLLKPIEPARLATALKRVREALETRDSAERIAELQAVIAQLRQTAGPAPTGRWAREIWVTHRNEQISVPVEDIEWVRAERDYVRIFSRSQNWLLRGGLDQLQERLDPERFVRTHRSALVRLTRVRKVRREGARVVLVLESGASAPVARTRLKDVKARLRGPA